MEPVPLTDQEFVRFRDMIRQVAGISMSDIKKPLVSGRLLKRVKAHGLRSFSEYFQLVMRGGEEFQIAVDLLTTNETYFFREPSHFEFLKSRILDHWRPGRPLRVWSAACSSGEEAWTLAMVLDSSLGAGGWEILASDISTRMLDNARRGIYPMQRATEMPHHVMTRYCLKGIGEHEGTLMVGNALRQQVRFMQINLNAPLPDLGEFDVIFLRNVMIYFDMKTKQEVVERIMPLLRPNGCLFVSHSESLNGVTDRLNLLQPSVYQKS